MEVGLHSSTLVVGGWNDWNRLSCDVQAGAETCLVNRRKAGFDEIGGLVRDVQINALGTAAFHLRIDGAGYDIARGEFLLGIVVFHEAAAAFVDQDGTFAAHRFGDEKGLDGGMVEASRVELDELHVRNHSTGPPRHGDTIPRSDIGIRRVEIHLPATASGQHGDIAAEGLHLTRGFIQDINANAAVLHRVAEFAGGYEIHRHVVFHDLDARMRGDLGNKCALDFAAGCVLEMEDASLGVAALATEVQFMVAVSIFALVEVDAELHQLSDSLRAFGNDFAHGVLVAESRPRIKSVSDVEFEGILVTHHTGHAALGPGGVRVGNGAFGDEGNATFFRSLQSKGEPCDAAAKDDEIKFSHGMRGRGMLSMSLALPRKTATARRPAIFRFESGASVKASTASM